MEEQPATGFNLKSKKTLIGLVGIVLLLIAIPAAVYLAQQKQIFKPKAGGIAPISGPETSFNLSARPSVEVGSWTRVIVFVRSDIDAANLFAAKLKFSPDLLAVKSINTESTSTNLTHFVTNWVENVFDNITGTASIVGGVTAPGYQTAVGQFPGEMAEVDFLAKKVGSAVISFDAGSAIYRNSDNADILNIKREVSIDVVAPLTPTPICNTLLPGSCTSPTPTCTPRPACLDLIPRCLPPEPSEGWCPDTITPTPAGIKGDINNDGVINLVDMSALLSRWGKSGPEAGKADINGDGVINSVDYSMMIKILIDNKVIQSAAEVPQP